VLRIEAQAWAGMVDHARATYPNECVGIMLGTSDDGLKTVKVALAMENVSPGQRRVRYTLDPKDLLAAEREARRRALNVLGVYHSHPDCGAYFSETDLKNSCPWYSFVVISVRKGRVSDAKSWLPDAEQKAAESEPLRVGRNFLPPLQWIRSYQNGKGIDPHSPAAIRREK
jgi:proteasome lid subunit RPN8/RPN11